MYLFLKNHSLPSLTRSLLYFVAAIALLLTTHTSVAFAHPADITVTDFFVERDWENTELETNRLRAVHSINWFEAMEVLDPEAEAADMLADLSQYENTIANYLEENLIILNGNAECTFENIFIPEQSPLEVVAVGLFFDFDVVCERHISEVTVTASFLLDKYPDQSNFLTFYRFPGELIVTDSVNLNNPTVTHIIADPEVVQTPLELFSTFIYEGIRHIVPLGLDHILFIMTVFLIAGTLRRVIVFSLLFTLAHSITLALTVLGVIVPDSSLIEAIIALSIVVLAVDAIHRFIPNVWQGTIIFGFGLFHGMGFASVLTDLGLPENAEISALIGFNIGVEIGQLGVVLTMALATWWFFKEAKRKEITTIAIALAIAAIATYWLIERTLM